VGVVVIVGVSVVVGVREGVGVLEGVGVCVDVAVSVGVQVKVSVFVALLVGEGVAVGVDEAKILATRTGALQALINRMLPGSNNRINNLFINFYKKIPRINRNLDKCPF
jgi:hypothetical protein